LFEITQLQIFDLEFSQKIEFKTARDVITTTIKLLDNIPKINKLLKLSSLPSNESFLSQQLLQEIIEMIKDNIIIF
jgi:hypothetical protein